ncbi:MAG: hypothetical protein RIT45_3074 [Pseudomonadota bacterium]|jgi:hypothetical protein
MDAWRERLGALVGGLYIASPVLMLLAFAAVAPLGVAALGALAHALLRRRRRLALATGAVALLSAPFAVFVAGVADRIA